MTSTPRTDDDDDVWPALAYADWQPTLITLHMWMQIVGKVKLELTPFLNDWWNVTFTLTARGLTTSTIPFDRRAFQVDFDFVDHRLGIHVKINTRPVEVDDGIAFEHDDVHATYDPIYVNRWWRILLGINRVLER